ncbi:hypothetical protein BMS3Bbin02_01176 [bacterium BMS3Bbin02]|nr:hypothetical protein BMS3Bbin02_01176 [bacterium BMS3Bbin02]HDH25805.1 hypothetical protein [Actinomycetota bacterium]
MHNKSTVDTVVAHTADDFIVTVEADTVEQALAEVTTRYGEMTEVVNAEKVHRGGLGGFFAKERVRITVRPPDLDSGVAAGVDAMFDRLAAAAEVQDRSFDSMLNTHLANATELRDDTRVLFEAAGWDVPDDSPTLSEIHATAVLDDRSDQIRRDDREGSSPVVVGPLATDAGIEPVILDERLAPGAPGQKEIRPHRFPRLDEVVTVTVDPIAPVQADQLDPLARPDWVTELSDAALRTATGTPTQGSPVPDVEAPMHSQPMVPTVELPAWRLHSPGDDPTRRGAVQWSALSLARLGLPAVIVESVTGLDPHDDMAWIEAIAGSVASFCGPLPRRPLVVAGEGAASIAVTLGMDLVAPHGNAPYTGSFCASVGTTADDIAWLEFVRGDRDLHIVIGSSSWRDFLVADVGVVSWIGRSSLVDALYVCATLGAVLGYGTVDGAVSAQDGAELVRARPLDVALAIRTMVGRI